jgi:hypothetical protein
LEKPLSQLNLTLFLFLMHHSSVHQPTGSGAGKWSFEYPLRSLTEIEQAAGMFSPETGHRLVARLDT